MGLLVGVFVVPDATDPAHTLAQIEAADAGGLDLVGIQDHPYQRRFLDTWTLLSYAAARTARIRLVPDVANLPLRPPAVLAKAAASLDLLTGGRVELGLGAGAFWEAIGAMGGPVRSGGESVDALVEAIGVIRAMWSGERSVRREGRHYALDGVHPGPVPAHRIGIWLGAYGPRMLRVTGRLADGWLPSVPLDEVSARQAPSTRPRARRGVTRATSCGWPTSPSAASSKASTRSPASPTSCASTVCSFRPPPTAATRWTACGGSRTTSRPPCAPGWAARRAGISARRAP
jgi:alkanesulfonate monooxygenase SsuD/methylene tetrahydromethanopterin reductase-like flavin-dependent oxidoreductase (luciferase family)